MGGDEQRTGPKRDIDEYEENLENVPPQLVAALGAADYFKELVRSGKQFDTLEMDAVDDFLAHVFQESAKTEKGSMRVVLDNPRIERVILPKARSILALIDAMQCKVRVAEMGSEAHVVAQEAWTTLSKNYYYSDDEKDRFLQGIAMYANKLINEADAMRDAPYTNSSVVPGSGAVVPGFEKKEKKHKEEIDIIFKVGWKKGIQGIEEEWRNRGVEMPVDYDQEETDWNQEAVIDEDQLK